MDFALKLSKTTRGHESILVVIDRFTKMTHFIPCSNIVDVSPMSKLFLNDIMRLHDLPSSIVSNKDVMFVSYFRKTLWKLLGTTLKYSSTFNPQIDGQTKVVNCNLSDLLRYLIGKKHGNWDLIFPTAKFA